MLVSGRSTLSATCLDHARTWTDMLAAARLPVMGVSAFTEVCKHVPTKDRNTDGSSATGLCARTRKKKKTRGTTVHDRRRFIPPVAIIQGPAPAYFETQNGSIGRIDRAGTMACRQAPTRKQCLARTGPCHTFRSAATGWLQIQPLKKRLPVTEEALRWRVGCGDRVD